MIYNYLHVCNQFLSQLMLVVLIPLRWGVLDTALRDKICQWLAGGGLFSPGTPVSSTIKTDSWVFSGYAGWNKYTTPHYFGAWMFCFMVFNAIFNNISAISWRSALLAEETGVPGENHRPAASRRLRWYHTLQVKFDLLV